jgi:hypothetical protein
MAHILLEQVLQHVIIVVLGNIPIIHFGKHIAYNVHLDNIPTGLGPRLACNVLLGRTLVLPLQTVATVLQATIQVLLEPPFVRGVWLDSTRQGLARPSAPAVVCVGLASTLVLALQSVATVLQATIRVLLEPPFVRGVWLGSTRQGLARPAVLRVWQASTLVLALQTVATVQLVHIRVVQGPLAVRRRVQLGSTRVGLA